MLNDEQFAPWSQEVALETIRAHAAMRGPLLPVLHALQSRFGFVDPRAVRLVAAELNLSRAADRMPQGVVYTTFHYPASGANIVTTNNSDWATNCPEYKVTAVQVMPTPKAPAGDPSHRQPGPVQLGLEAR